MNWNTTAKLPEAGEQPAAEPLIAPTGDTSVDALAEVVNNTAQPFQEAPPPEQGEVGVVSHWVNAALAVVGAPFELLNTGLALLVSPLDHLTPGMPAAVLGVPHRGVPHAHPHPPSLNAPLPSLGTTLGSCCVSVLIGGIPAARAGDLGIAPTCGSFFPGYDIWTGSSNTYIGGSRAARMSLDITRHCNPASAFGKFGMAMTAVGAAAGGLSAAAQAEGGEGGEAAMTAAQAAADAATMALGALLGKDPGVPPSTGTLAMGNPTVLIGGFPLPDAMDVAGGLAKAAKKLPELAAPKSKKANPDCDRPGHPVDPVTGASADELVDYQDQGPGRFTWERYYYSHWSEEDGPLGFGFRHSLQHELLLLRTRALYIDPRRREYEFPRQADGHYAGTFGGYTLSQPSPTRFILRHDRHATLGFERGSPEDIHARLAGIVVDNIIRRTPRYHPDGRLECLCDVDETGEPLQTWWFHYDTQGHITEVLRARPDDTLSVARYAYDGAGCLATWYDALGHSGSHGYDAQRRMTRVTDRNGYSFSYAYDAQGRCVHSEGQDQLWRVDLAYEPGRTRVTEADGGEWLFLYNEAGTVVCVIDPYEGERNILTHADGHIVEEEDSGGRVMRWLYDPDGRNTGRMDRWGNVWPTKDDAPNLPNPLEHKVPGTPLGLQWGEAIEHLPAAPLDLPAGLAELAVDVLALPEPLPPQTRHDVLGRMVERIDAYGRREHFEHDPAGNLVRFTDKDGHEHHYTTTSWNLRGSETDPLGHSVRYGYTRREKVRQVIDANGNESTYDYDYKDRITRVVRHGVTRETYAYDTGDRLIEKRDAHGDLLLRFEVGDNGLHSTRLLASGEEHRYQYDERGHFTETSSDTHEVCMSHDWADRRTSDLRDGEGVRHQYRGRHLARTTYFDRFTVDYAVQPGDPLLIHTPDGSTQRLQRGADGHLLLALGNGSRELRRFDLDGRCIGRLYWPAGQPEAARWQRYRYSGEGELQQVESNADGIREYRYDAAHRLVWETRDGSTTRRYAYDPGGNLLATPAVPWMRYREGNRLETSSAGTYRYDHRNHLCEVVDAHGHSTRYHYNSMDLLVKVTWSDRPDAWTAEYDGLCRRIAKALGQARTEYHWDGDRLAAETAPDGRLRLYVYANEDAFLPFLFLDYDTPDAPPESGRAYFVFCNQAGLPERIEDAQGREAWRAEDIDPYGLIHVAEGNAVEYDLRWPGHWVERETGLHCNRFRVYCPRLGRYLQSDPMGQEGGINLYSYPTNPLAAVDVLGLTAACSSSKGNKEGSDGKGPDCEAPKGHTPGSKGHDSPSSPKKPSFRQKLFKNMKPGVLKCKILRAEPVNILNGEVSVGQSDFTLPWHIPLEWTRNYASGSERPGACGVGWECPADARLEIDTADGGVMFSHPSEGPTLFPMLPAGIGDAAAVLELMDGARLIDHGDEWRVRTKSDLIYHFPKALLVRSEDGLREVPLDRISDLCGNWLDYEREDGRLRTIRESGGRHLLVEYAGQHIRSLTLCVSDADFSHTFVTYEHDEQGHLTTVRDELGNPHCFAYDGHHMVRHTNRTGLSFHYEYDESSETWQVVRAWGDGGLYDYHFAYAPAFREVRITDSLGHVSTVQCDENGLPVLEIDPLGGRTLFEYDEVGRTTAVVDAGNHRTQYAYDERGNLLELIRPDGSALAIQVDACNKPTAITDPNGATWGQCWDERGLLVEQTSPLGAVTTYEYSEAGLLVGVTDALNATTRLGYDSDGYLVGVENALGQVTRLKRDLLGNVLERGDPLGRSTTYRYDSKSRLVEATLPGSAHVRCAYDAQDNLTHYEDENGARTRFEYFGQGLVAKRYQPDGHVVHYHYDTEEQLVGVSNQRGERYELKRDALGRVVEEVDYWGQATRYVFDIAGHLKQSCDPLGRVIDYTTDKLGRIRRKRFEHPFEAGRQFEETFDFDANGNLTGCANEHVTVTRTHDAQGRLLEERQGEFAIKNGFDALGRRIRRETSAGNTVAYAYDALGQPTSIHINDEPPITIERDAAGQVVKETLAPALERHYQYDAEGRLTAQGVRREAEWLFDTQYAYDAAGNLTHRKDSQYGLDQYRYDPLGQIVEHIDPQGKLKRFFQDPVGDRLTTRVREDGLWRREGWYEGVLYRFDAAGNLLERRDERQLEGIEAPKTLALEWDANQRLVRSRTRPTFGGGEAGTVETAYGYDPLGRRVFKRTGNDWTGFGWEGDALVAEGADDASQELAQREYLYYPGGFVPLVLVDGQGCYRFHTDPNGCPTRLTKSDGHVVWAARYEVWGQVRDVINEVANSVRLQGQYKDDETGLHYNRFRYYDPLVGSFISSDPIGLAGGVSIYKLTSNIFGWADPMGLTAWRIADPLDLLPDRSDDFLKTSGLLYPYQIDSGVLTQLDARGFVSMQHDDIDFQQLRSAINSSSFDSRQRAELQSIADHVEPKAANYLRSGGFPVGNLYINHSGGPCPGCSSLSGMFLNVGQVMRVFFVGDSGVSVVHFHGQRLRAIPGAGCRAC
ncbi:RHS repeat-associated core domain-containing protein [Pseudomonas chlororaphis]|uniref:RHS repeat-associated core domain-containing protein n=1 Tax=Pseudomonas chlororaphis TaxID=587753 RepID=UPI000F57F8A9|nr:RHS repeat-associated core domain-containing protein [Pseudomonas chlororaphis]AZD73465.1 hypothetical protein C4K16_3105 [Pseudomonas chlororaphis subsp. aurantiaca]